MVSHPRGDTPSFPHPVRSVLGDMMIAMSSRHRCGSAFTECMFRAGQNLLPEMTSTISVSISYPLGLDYSAVMNAKLEPGTSKNLHWASGMIFLSIPIYRVRCINFMCKDTQEGGLLLLPGTRLPTSRAAGVMPLQYCFAGGWVYLEREWW